jgi:integrase
MRRERAFVSWPRHALTGQAFRVSARSARELDALLHDLDSLRIDLRHGFKSTEEYDRAIRRFQHGQVTIDRCARAYLGTVSPNTARRVLSWLAVLVPPGFGDPRRFDVHALSGPAVFSWLEALRARKYRESTLTLAWRTLRAVVRYAAERGWIAGVPWGTWRPSRHRDVKPRALREACRVPAELSALLAAAAELDAERERVKWRLGDLRAKIAAAAIAGLRQGELAGLRWCDLARPLVHVVQQYDGLVLKTGRKTIEVLADLFEILDAHRARLVRAELFAPRGPVFPSRVRSTPGKPRHYTSGECLTRADLRSVVSKAGLPNVGQWSAHSLRDSFATLEQRGAVDLRALQGRLGHASPASTVRYLRTVSRDSAPPGFSLDAGPSHGPGVEKAPALLSPHKATARGRGRPSRG